MGGRRQVESLRYSDVVGLLQVFDRKNVGSLDAKHISLFFTHVQQKWVDAGKYTVLDAEVVG